MSRRDGILKRIYVLAIVSIVAGTGCSDNSTSNNWNNMFGRKDDRRVEPRSGESTDAGRPKSGAPAAKPETASNDYASKTSSDGEPTSADRSDPSAIEQYAANMNPPSNRGPRINANRPATGETSNRSSATPSNARGADMQSPTDSSMNRSAPNRPAANQPIAAESSGSAGNQMPERQAPRNNNAMFIDSSGGSSPANANANSGGLPSVESRSAQTEPPARPIDDSSRIRNARTNGAPMINNVTAAPGERPTTNSDIVRTASVNDRGTTVQPEATVPTEDAAAERRRRDIAAQEGKVAADPTNVEEQFKLRTMYLFDGRDSDALAPIRGVTPEVQEIILAQLRSLQAARSGDSRDPATWANRQLSAMRVLQEKLRAKADLQVPKVELCTEIRQFGVYTPFPSSDFKAGVPNDVLIYVEVDNFESREMPSGEYRTLLGARLTLMSKDGKELVSLDEPNIEDFSRGVRRDFFLAFGPITVPANLPVGEYLVKVEIDDKLAGKINSNSTSLRLVP